MKKDLFNSSLPTHALSNSALGKSTEYITEYTQSLLFAIPRESNRLEIGLTNSTLPFTGLDFWRSYEISWLDLTGKPINGIAEISIPVTTPNLIESKSMKLYFNSFNQSKFVNKEVVSKTIQQDFMHYLTYGSTALEDLNLQVDLFTPDDFHLLNTLSAPLGENIDSIAIKTNIYTVTPELLSLDKNNQTIVTEILNSNLLRSNCPITKQPDWATVTIEYIGKAINKESLLKYIISFRQHNEFHEQCVERIFVDIMRHCQPEKLAVLAQFTRRGGIEINPYRSNFISSLRHRSRTFFQ